MIIGRINDWLTGKPRYVNMARLFANKVKSDHRVPALEADTYKAAGAININLELQPSGNYKVSTVWFEDGSIWSSGGNVYNG